MADLPKEPDICAEMEYRRLITIEKKRNRKVKKKDVERPPPPPPPVLYPYPEKTSYDDDDGPCEPEVVMAPNAAPNKDARHPVSDTPAADDKESMVEKTADWDCIAPAERATDECEDSATVADGPWPEERKPAGAEAPATIDGEPTAEEEGKPANESVYEEPQPSLGTQETGMTASLPFSSQYKLLAYIQEVLERACFSYGQRRFRGVLHRRGWDCVEAVPLSTWMKEFLGLRHTFDIQPSEELLEGVASIQEMVVKRTPIDWCRMRKVLNDAVELVEILRIKEYGDIIEKVRLDMGKVVEVLSVDEVRVEEEKEKKLRLIAGERKILDEREAQVVREGKKSRGECYRAAESQVKRVVEDGKERSDTATYFLELTWSRETV